MRSGEITAREAIQREFMREYCEKSYGEITVKGLCANTPVARTTFYSYYGNVDELMNDVEDMIINGIVEIGGGTSKGHIEDMDFSVFFSRTLEYIKEYWDEIEGFLIIQPNVRFIRKWKEAVKKHFALRFPHKCGTVNFELISETVASGVIGAYSYWLQNPKQVDVKKLNQIVGLALECIDDII